MGCKTSSEVREDGSAVNPENLPKVPLGTWYALPFSEASAMPVTPYHEAHKGDVVFAPHRIPSRQTELDGLPHGKPDRQRSIVLGETPCYGMGYLHNTALFVEHTWRQRVAMAGHIPNRFERPFYDMLLGVKVSINGLLVPDSFPHDKSLVQCTATYNAPEGTTTWKAVPVTLVPTKDDWMLTSCSVYQGLVFSFLEAAITLDEGPHSVLVEVVYGCKKENNFCTQHIARGGFEAIVTADGKKAMQDVLLTVGDLLDDNPQPMVPLKGPHHDACHYCGHKLRYTCTVCCARVCGTPACVWSSVVGYPTGCKSHKAMVGKI